MKRDALLFITLLICSLTAMNQVPTDNPYKSRYKIKEHWTDDFKWSKVTNAADVAGLINEKNEIDKTIFQNTMKRISNEGGGVLYFGPGEYYANFTMRLHNGCVLRGASPRGVTSAISSGYRPSTKFQFPKFVMNFHGEKLNDDDAFKRIIADINADIAVVNLDINRGMIDSRNNSKYSMIFGVRSNNATEHKAVFMPASIGLGWQRYPTAEVGNIYIMFQQGVIANCRVNDSITDDFEIPNFMANDGRIFKDTAIKFQYGLQSGISVKNSEGKPARVEFLENYVKGYLVDNIFADFEGEILKKNNKISFLPCQDLLGQEFYPREVLEHTTRAFEKKNFISKENDSLEYWLLSPKNYDPNKKYPIVLFFHGRGQHGKKNPLIHYVSIYANEEARDKFPCFVVVPHIKNGEQFSSSLDTTPTRAYTLSIDLFKSIEKQYSIDTGNTCIAGLSSGGMGAIEATVRDPDLFRRAVIMSAIRPINSDQSNRVKNIHFIFSTGTEDPREVDFFHNAVKALRNQGNKVDYFEYPTGHWSWLNLCIDQKFLNIVLK
jgi:predicted esterase